MSLNDLLIPNTPAQEAVEVDLELEGLECFMNDLEQELWIEGAMEAAGGEPDPVDDLGGKARLSFKKLAHGKKTNNKKEVTEAKKEIHEIGNTLNEEDRKADREKDQRRKQKIKKIAMIVGAAAAAALLGFVAVKGGKAISNSRANKAKALADKSRQGSATTQELTSAAKDTVDELTEEFEKNVKEFKTLAEQAKASGIKLSDSTKAKLNEVEKASDSLQKSIDNARKSGVSENKILHNKGEVDNYFTGKNNPKSFENGGEIGSGHRNKWGNFDSLYDIPVDYAYKSDDIERDSRVASSPQRKELLSDAEKALTRLEQAASNGSASRNRTTWVKINHLKQLLNASRVNKSSRMITDIISEANKQASFIENFNTGADQFLQRMNDLNKEYGVNS